jgi:cysteinyl-tRNA synthetase
MSKSLKNFITIDVSVCDPSRIQWVYNSAQEILQKHSARQLRIAFLTQLWNSKMDFSESLMTGEVKTIETTLNVRYSTRRLISRAYDSLEFFHVGESSD